VTSRPKRDVIRYVWADGYVWPDAEPIDEPIVHGEHPMEDDIDRALGWYPGTSVEVNAFAAAVRVPVLKPR